jgi:hypothetical protein
MNRIAIAALLASKAAAAEPPPDGDKSLMAAYAISVGATSGPCLLGVLVAGDDAHGSTATAAGIVALGGLVLGPSAGHWYAGETITTGLELRLGSAALFATAAIADPHLAHTGTYFAIAGAAGLYASGFAWDALTLPRAVHRANHPALVPVIAPGGVGVAGRF